MKEDGVLIFPLVGKELFESGRRFNSWKSLEGEEDRHYRLIWRLVELMLIEVEGFQILWLTGDERGDEW